jgi:hypothetical protein
MIANVVFKYMSRRDDLFVKYAAAFEANLVLLALGLAGSLNVDYPFVGIVITGRGESFVFNLVAFRAFSASFALLGAGGVNLIDPSVPFMLMLGVWIITRGRTIARRWIYRAHKQFT